MARKKKRRKPQQKIPILAALGAAAGIVYSWTNAAGSANTFFNLLVSSYTGFAPDQGNFEIQRLRNGLLPLAIGSGGSMVAAKTGVNRRLKVPFIKF